jgi:hypothetical protein
MERNELTFHSSPDFCFSLQILRTTITRRSRPFYHRILSRRGGGKRYWGVSYHIKSTCRERGGVRGFETAQARSVPVRSLTRTRSRYPLPPKRLSSCKRIHLHPNVEEISMPRPRYVHNIVGGWRQPNYGNREVCGARKSEEVDSDVMMTG